MKGESGGAAKKGSLRGAVPLCHFFLRQKLQEGDVAVDATCGNGFDTLLLAELVGAEGKVFAFDVQPHAIASTRALLKQEGRLCRVQLVEGGHEGLAEVVPSGIRAVVFNLGYLPGGDSSLVTSPANTVAALEQAASLLVPGGIIAIAIYTGHPGGPQEASAVESWGASLSPMAFNVWCSRQLNRPAHAPYLVLVEKV